MSPRGKPPLYLSLYEDYDGSGFYALFHRDDEPVFYMEVRMHGMCRSLARVFVLGLRPDGKPVMVAGLDELELDTFTASDTADFVLGIYWGRADPCSMRCKVYRAGRETVVRKLREAVEKLRKKLAEDRVVPIAERVLVSGRQLPDILRDVERGGSAA